ncbi:MAG: hypothetical protein IJI84_04435 [Clostridia bacterium]|nr:hypothetical protein [Clostridia bacterium]
MSGSLLKKLNKVEITNPTVEISVNGKKFEQEGSMYCSYVRVDLSAGPEAAVCLIDLIDPYYLEDGEIHVNDKFKKITLGSKIEVSLGYSEDVGTVFSGYVYTKSTDIIGDVKGNKSVVRIKCMDSKIFMMQNKYTLQYKKETSYSKVVKSVLARYKLLGSKVKIAGEKKFNKGFLLHQTYASDYEFLAELAEKTGCLFYSDSSGKINFTSPKNASNNKLSTLEFCNYVFDVKSAQNMMGIPASLEVSSLDKKDPTKLIKSTVKDSEKIGSGSDVSKSSKNMPSKSIISIVDNDAHSLSEAKFRAQAEYNLRELNLMQTVMKIKGCYYFEIGKKLKLKNFNGISDNEYIITRVVHEYSAERRSYYTQLSLNANRIKLDKSF